MTVGLEGFFIAPNPTVAATVELETRNPKSETNPKGKGANGENRTNA